MKYKTKLIIMLGISILIVGSFFFVYDLMHPEIVEVTKLAPKVVG